MQNSKLTKEEIYQGTYRLLGPSWQLRIDAETQGIVWTNRVDGLRVLITTDLGTLPEAWDEDLKFKNPWSEINQGHHLFGKHPQNKEDQPRELFHVSTDSVTHVVDSYVAIVKAIECIQEVRELTTRSFY